MRRCDRQGSLSGRGGLLLSALPAVEIAPGLPGAVFQRCPACGSAERMNGAKAGDFPGFCVIVRQIDYWPHWRPDNWADSSLCDSAPGARIIRCNFCCCCAATRALAAFSFIRAARFSLSGCDENIFCTVDVLTPFGSPASLFSELPVA